MFTEVIQPNLHVALVHFPIGIFVAGVIVETWCLLLARRSSLRVAGRWMILFGTIMAVPVTMSGLHAMQDVMKTGELIGASWKQTLEKSPIATNPAVWQAMTNHLWLSVSATAAAVVCVSSWIAMSDAWRKRLGWLAHLGLILACATMIVSAYHGGELVHVHRVTTLEIVRPQAPPTTSPTFYGSIIAVGPPLQVHVIFAGLTIALSCVALAVSVRIQSTPVVEGQPRRANARYWWLVVLITVATTASGWWYLANASDVWSMAKMFELLGTEREFAGTFFTRRTVHVVGASTLFFSTIVLALFCWLSPQAKVLLTLAGVIVFAALLCQVWVGTVLLLDGTHGPVTVFSP